MESLVLLDRFISTTVGEEKVMSIFNHPCKYPNCPVILRDAGYCKMHKRYEPKREKDQDNRYNNSRWKSLRKVILAHEPLCRICKENKRVTPANTIDHIIPITSADDPLFWEESNLQPLCVDCHSEKTEREKKSKVY